MTIATLTAALIAVVVALTTGCATVGVRSPVAGVGLYDDPRVMAWARDYLDLDRQAVLRAVEADLRSAAPHPFAPYVWVLTHRAVGDLEDAWSGLTDPTLRRALGVLPSVYLLFRTEQYRTILERYPLAEARRITDVWAITWIANAALQEHRYREAWDYAEHLMWLRPDNFQGVWVAANAAEVDDRVRAHALRTLETGRLAGTLAARALVPVLRQRPYRDEATVRQSRAWLAEQPNDARALRHLGVHVIRLGKYADVDGPLEEATRLFPFVAQSWEEQGTALVRRGLVAAARAVVERSASLDARDAAAAAPLTEERMARVLAEADRREEARTVLARAQEAWPSHAGLAAERARLEIADERFTDAVPFAEQAARLAPDSLTNQVRLVEARRRAGDRQQAWAVFEAVEPRKKSYELYLEGSRVLADSGRNAERVVLWERAGREYPQHSYTLQQWAEALADSERPREAIAKYRESFEARAPWAFLLTRLAIEVQKVDGMSAASTMVDDMLTRFPWLDRVRDSAPTPLLDMAEKPPAPEPARTPTLVVRTGHAHALTSVAFSADGRWIVTGGADGSTLLWSARTGEQLRRLAATSGPASGVAFTRHDTEVLTISASGDIGVSSVVTGERRSRAHMPQRMTPLASTAIAPGGRFIAATGDLLPVGVWDATTGTERVHLPHVTGRLLAFSPDRRFLLTAIQNTLALWEIGSPRPLDGIDEDGKTRERLTLWGHRQDVTAAAFSADGRFVVSVARDRTVRLWHLRAGVELQRVVIDAEPSAVAYDSTRGLAIIGDSRGAVYAWKSGERATRPRPLDGLHRMEIKAIALSADGRTVATACEDGLGGVWDVTSGRLLHTLRGMTVAARQVALGSDGRTLTTVSQAGTRTWDLTTGFAGEPVGIPAALMTRGLASNEPDPVTVAAFSRDGRWLFTASRDRVTQLRDLKDGASPRRLAGPAGNVSHAQFSPDGSVLVAGTRDGAIRLWETATGRLIRRTRGVDWPGSVAFSPDGRWVALGTEYGAPVVLDATTGLEVLGRSRAGTGPGPDETVWSVAFAPDGGLIVTGGGDGTARVLEFPGGREVRSVRHGTTGPVVAVAFSPDGARFATADGQSVKLWMVATGKQIAQVPSGGSDGLAFSPDGRRLVAGDLATRALTLWSVDDQRAIAVSARPAEGQVRQAMFSADGRMLVMVDLDGAVRLVDSLTGRERAALFSLGENGWAVVDPEGRYDGAGLDAGALYWVRGDETLPLESFGLDRRVPGLLGRVLPPSPRALGSRP